MLRIFIAIILINAYNALTLPEIVEINGEKYFYYFGYGSNLLEARIKIQNPSAERVGAGKLANYRLDFNSYTQRWMGAPATIVPTDNATVYGSLWIIALHNLADIDHQEGVHENIYKPISVQVQLLSNETFVMARTYVLVSQPETALNEYQYDEVPANRQPSKTYLQCLVKGAIESELPLEYITWMRSLHHNQRITTDLQNILHLKDVLLLH